MNSPLVTQISFSGGTGSGALIEMLLRDAIPRPKNLVVIRANPGMENEKTNEYCRQVAAQLLAVGIPYIEVRRDLFRGLMEARRSGKTRFDLPPFWTKNKDTGKRGRLLQRCTKWAKIAPMDAACRDWMQETLGISARTKRLGHRSVCKWIGFSADEWHRIKEDRRRYLYCDYPLVNMGITRQGIHQYYADIGVAIPPRSVCNACFANDVATFKKMHDESPEEFWGQAVAVDEEIRDLRYLGVTDECYVSSTLMPLRELAARQFLANSSEELDSRCHSGHCFI